MRILIAEDEPLEAEALRRRLAALGHEVVGVVHDGAQAVTQATALTPDLVFLDLRMPKLDGITAAQAILAHRHLATILITGDSDRTLVAQATQAGVLALVVKPVDGGDLEQAIRLAMTRLAALQIPPPPETGADVATSAG
jgi:response regulator NasT